MHPAILFLQIDRFVKRVFLILSRDQSDAPGDLLRLGGRHLRLCQKTSDRFVSHRLVLDVLFQLRNRLDRACLDELGPELDEKCPRSVDVGTVDLAVNREDALCRAAAT